MRKKNLANVKAELVTSATVIAGLGYTPTNNTDNTRTTDAKDVTGAINELNAKIIALENIINNNNFIIT